MFQWLKKYFVPHPENDHQPHLLRSDVVGFLLWVVFFLELAFLVPILGAITKTDFFATILPSVLIDSANESRQVSHLGSLHYNSLLEGAAKRKAKDMALNGYFAHVSPAGVQPWKWLDDVGYTYTNAGENLAVNFSDSKDIHNAWMNSPGHRANILNGKYTEIGIATATGKYKGQQAIFVVQFFGRPSKKTLTPVAVTPQPTASAFLKSNPSPTLLATAGEAEGTFVEIGQDPDSAPVTSLSNRLQRILSEPHALFNNIFGGMFAIIALALLLSMATRLEFQHHPSLINGLTAIIIITAVLLFNQEVSTLTASIY